MPDSRSHRGPDPRDAEAFGAMALPALRAAVADLSWLQGHGYAPVSALKLVGDRWSLTERQRQAVRRCACGDEALTARRNHQVQGEAVRGELLEIDGFNVLTTVEVALGGAVVLGGRDGCFRDVAGVHGTYRKVEETSSALLLIGETLSLMGVSRVRWLLDSPVSNGGRLKTMTRSLAESRGWDWSVELVFDPDPLLSASAEVVATADSVILDHGPRWFSLARTTIETHVPGAWTIDLGRLA